MTSFPRADHDGGVDDVRTIGPTEQDARQPCRALIKTDDGIRLHLVLQVFEVLVVTVVGELVERTGAGHQLTATVRALGPVTAQVVECLGFHAAVVTPTQRAHDAAVPRLGAIGHKRKRLAGDVQRRHRARRGSEHFALAELTDGHASEDVWPADTARTPSTGSHPGARDRSPVDEPIAHQPSTANPSESTPAANSAVWSPRFPSLRAVSGAWEKNARLADRSGVVRDR